MKAPTGRSHGLAHVLDWAVGRGAGREKLLARIDVEPALLDDGEARIPLAGYYAGIEAAVAELRDPFLGLHYIESVEVSYLVGFAEPSVFHRAFKRWTGETAASYRARSREKRG